MKLRIALMIIASLAIAPVVAWMLPENAIAHCDTMDGPVVRDARQALESGNVNFVLIWVKKDSEAEIRDAFSKTLAVRKLSPQAKELADMYFFETLVRVHRAGEGAPYTGLKPAGSVIDPGLVAADHAVESGSADELMKHLTEAVHSGVLEHFNEVKAKMKYDKNDVEAGREFVESYVVFIHYVERLFQDAERPAGGHFDETGAAPVHHEH